MRMRCLARSRRLADRLGPSLPARGAKRRPVTTPRRMRQRGAQKCTSMISPPSRSRPSGVSSSPSRSPSNTKRSPGWPSLGMWPCAAAQDLQTCPGRGGARSAADQPTAVPRDVQASNLLTTHDARPALLDRTVLRKGAPAIWRTHGCCDRRRSTGGAAKAGARGPPVADKELAEGVPPPHAHLLLPPAAPQLQQDAVALGARRCRRRGPEAAGRCGPALVGLSLAGATWRRARAGPPAAAAAVPCEVDGISRFVLLLLLSLPALLGEGSGATQHDRAWICRQAGRQAGRRQPRRARGSS